jgi:hypothetical protein
MALLVLLNFMDGCLNRTSFLSLSAAAASFSALSRARLLAIRVGFEFLVAVFSSQQNYNPSFLDFHALVSSSLESPADTPHEPTLCRKADWHKVVGCNGSAGLSKSGRGAVSFNGGSTTPMLIVPSLHNLASSPWEEQSNPEAVSALYGSFILSSASASSCRLVLGAP